MKFCKYEYGKNKTERSPQIVQDRDYRAPYQRITSNTKLFNIFSKVKNFEKKTGKILGLSHVLQQKTPEQNKVDMCHDHTYCGLLPQCNELNSPVNTKDRDELISPIKEHPVSMEEICARCEKVKKASFVTDKEIKRIESETKKSIRCSAVVYTPEIQNHCIKGLQMCSPEAGYITNQSIERSFAI